MTLVMRASMVVSACLVWGAASGCEPEPSPIPTVPAPPGLASGAPAALGAMAAGIASDGGEGEPMLEGEGGGRDEAQQPELPSHGPTQGPSQGLPL